MSASFNVGCDVSKQKVDICVMENGKQVIHEFAVSNTAAGLKKARECLSAWVGACLILEPTGHYHYLFALGLREAGFDVRLVNPYLMKQYANLGLRKTKTDKLDAKRLASLGASGIELRPYAETPAHIQQKAHIQTLHRLQDTKRKLGQRLRQLEELHETVGGLQDVKRSLRTALKSMDVQIAKLKATLEKGANENAKLISSIPGISLLSACTIVGALGDPSRFTDRDELTAYAGLDPSIIQSGTSIHRKSHVSKRGSAMLRRVLGQCAWGALMHNERFQAYFTKKKAEGKHYFSILVAIARKLLILIHAILQSRKPYDPKHLSEKICLTPV